jgi:hypothetical protein
VIVSRPEEVDEELMGWIRSSHDLCSGVCILISGGHAVGQGIHEESAFLNIKEERSDEKH